MTKELSYIDRLVAIVRGIEVTNRNGRESEGIEAVCRLFKDVQADGQKVMFIGNGGSAAIASHMAIDLSKNAHIAAMAFNDAAALTCLSNDFGYDQVFAKQIAYHGKPHDALVAISSSGMSPNIINAVNEARSLWTGGYQIPIVTLSGFDPENRLRKCGDINFYVPSDRYGFVELTHQIILHQIVDALTEEHERVEAMESVPSA